MIALDKQDEAFSRLLIIVQEIVTRGYIRSFRFCCGPVGLWSLIWKQGIDTLYLMQPGDDINKTLRLQLEHLSAVMSSANKVS